MSGERFQMFFEDGDYTALKNHLYNYELRRKAIERSLRGAEAARLLEVGSGISPVVTSREGVVYSELSVTALGELRRLLGRGEFVACDATRLPFKDGAFSCAVASEVLEHLADDEAALWELDRVVAPGGRLLITFPHRKGYFAADDVFVKHYRRYELEEMKTILARAGFRVLRVEKVLGPLDKAVMCLAVLIFERLERLKNRSHSSVRPVRTWQVAAFKWMNRCLTAWAWLDARVFPMSLSTVLLIEAEKVGKPHRH